jgi:hypothetical protein
VLTRRPLPAQSGYLSPKSESLRPRTARLERTAVAGGRVPPLAALRSDAAVAPSGNANDVAGDTTRPLPTRHPSPSRSGRVESYVRDS